MENWKEHSMLLYFILAFTKDEDGEQNQSQAHAARTEPGVRIWLSECQRIRMAH